MPRHGQHLSICRCSRGKFVLQPAPDRGDWHHLAFSPEQHLYASMPGPENLCYHRSDNSEKSMYSLDFTENRCTSVAEAEMNSTELHVTHTLYQLSGLPVCVKLFFSCARDSVLIAVSLDLSAW